MGDEVDRAAVVFLILTVIQFVVIAKGSERVAEVGARFVLDAMPRKQMAIDAEVRSVTLDGNEARHCRRQLFRESQFYGSMDGAMKFETLAVSEGEAGVAAQLTMRPLCDFADTGNVDRGGVSSLLELVNTTAGSRLQTCASSRRRHRRSCYRRAS